MLPHGLRPAAWRGYWRTAAITASSAATEGPLFLVDYLIRILRVLLLISIWRAVLGPTESFGGVGLSAAMTYTVIASAFAPLLDVRTQLVWTIWNGSIVTRYLQPIGLAGLYAAETAGEWFFGLLTFSLPLLLIAPLLGVDPLPASALHGVLFIVSLALGISVGLAIDFLFGALMLYLAESLWGIEQLRNAVGSLFSGALLPLAFYPWGLGDVFSWLPPAAMASAPLRVYTGTGDPLVLIASQIAWAVILWPVAGSAWRASRERMASMGG